MFRVLFSAGRREDFAAGGAGRRRTRRSAARHTKRVHVETGRREGD